MSGHTMVPMCVQCGKWPRQMDSKWCASCVDWHERGATLQRVAQSAAVEQMLMRDTQRILSWPFASLDALVGPMPPGSVAYVAGFSGQGKTTFLTECMRRWLDEGRRIAYMPLETEAAEWRVRYAAMSLGVNPADALSGRLRLREEAGDRVAHDQREALTLHYRALMRGPVGSNLYVCKDAMLDLDGFARNVSVITAEGFDALVVDHVDHVRPPDVGGGQANASASIQYSVLDIAKHYGIPIVCASQVNLNAVRGQNDKLGMYRPPEADHLYLAASAKLQVAAQVLALHRPIRGDLTPNEMKAARSDAHAAKRALIPGMTGVRVLKSRYYGENTGEDALLAFHAGRLRDLSPEEQRMMDAERHAVRTNDDLLT